MTDRSNETLERARGLGPQIAASADEIERQRRLPGTLVSALHDAGLFRMLLPRSLGGAELDPPTFVQVTEAIARADASTAWVICQTSGCSMTAAYLQPDVAREIFGGEPAGVLAWGPPTASKAVAEHGGYRLSGTFNFASGSRHATWLGGQAPIVEADGTPRLRNGLPERRTLLFPAASATMKDVWHVIGLRGTGSDSFTVSDVFVPHRAPLPGTALLLPPGQPLRLRLCRRGDGHRAELAGGLPGAGARQDAARLQPGAA
jgi:alkylation response protein AidB-like acyl-CoA dehydrogenase